MMPPTMTGTSPAPAARSPSSTSGTSSMCEPDRIESPTQCTSSATAAATICSRRQPDALVDHLEPGVAGPHGDLLGAVAVPVEAGLADQQPQPLAELLAGAAHPLAHRREVAVRPSPRRRPRAPETPVGARYSPNTSRSAPAHSPVVTPARAHRRRRRHQVGAGPRRRRAAAPAPRPRSAPAGPRRARPATAHGRRRAGPRRRGRRAWIARPRSAVSGLGSVVSNRLTPTTTSSPDSIRRRRAGVRGDQRRLHVAGLDRRRPRRPCACDRCHLGPRALDAARRPSASTTVEPGEEVVVLEQVGLVGEHLLHPQRPLLVPRPRQAERLVPRRQLHRPGPRVLATASRRASPARSAGRCSPAGPRSGPGELTWTP